MRKFKVGFRPAAESDLFGLYDYIAAESGIEVAEAYIGRIEAACLDLETFPRRGTQRDDLGTGIRILGFEHRATIVFRILKSQVVIIRILYGGRDYGRALGSSSME